MSEIFGAKVSRKGFDVNSASDKQLAFSSEWPLLPIEAEGEVTLTPAGGGGNVNQSIYTHGLSYTPVFTAERKSGGKFFFPGFVNCTDTELRFDGYLKSAVTLKWKVFRRPLKKNYTSESLITTDATEKDSGDFGIVVSLPEKDVNSTDKRDFCVRSDVRQIMVHMSGYTTADAYGFTATHNLGYQPMFWAYLEDTSDSSRYYMISLQDNFKTASTTTVLTGTYMAFPPRKFAYIIFKDTINSNG